MRMFSLPLRVLNGGHSSEINGSQDLRHDAELSHAVSHSKQLLLITATVMAIPLLLFWVRLFWGFVLDDSYIAYRYSENLATLGQLTWNPDENPVEGFTSLAWVLAGALFERLGGIRPHIAMPLFGVACWFMLMTIVLPLLTRQVVVGGSDGTRQPTALFLGVVTLVAIVSNPYLGFHAFHGLETALHILLFAAATYLALLPITAATTLTLAVATLISVTVRPDAVVFAFPLWTVRCVASSGLQRRVSVAGTAAFVAGVAVYTLIKWQYFGYPLPNTFYVKQGVGFQGASYVKDYLAGLVPLGLLLTFAAGRSRAQVLLRDKTFMMLVVPATVFCLAHVKIHAIVGYGYRFIIMTLPLLVLAGLRACVMMDRSADSRQQSTNENRFEIVTACVLTMLALVGLSAYRMTNYYPTLQKDFRALTVTPVRSGLRLEPATALMPPPLLASSDVGALPYFSRLRTLDLFGLNDERIAHEGLTHAYIAERNADLVVLQDLYLTADPQRRVVDSAKYPPVVINLDGEIWFVDMAWYHETGITAAPETKHNSAAKTFQVLTTPGFSSNYAYVTNWALGDMDRYYVFVRRGYPNFTDLVHILGTDDLDPDAHGHPQPNGNRGQKRKVTVELGVEPRSARP